MPQACTSLTQVWGFFIGIRNALGILALIYTFTSPCIFFEKCLYFFCFTVWDLYPTL